VIGWVTSGRLQVWLTDWHVYAAGAEDLLAKSLYRAELTYPPYILPVTEFNLPPLAAALAIPLLPLPDDLAGSAWLLLGWIATGLATWWLIYRCLRVPHGWVWVGIVAAIYAQSLSFVIHVTVANINDLVLGMLALYAVLHIRRRRTAAGVVLGVAAATKLWPIILVVPLIRRRRWKEIGAAFGTLAVLGGLLVAWMGFPAIPELVQAVTTTTVTVTHDNPVLWVTWLRERTTWWPDWGAPVVALGLLAIPARGLAAIGLAMLAGVSLVPNIWGHYFPTLAFAAGLIATRYRHVIPALATRVTSPAWWSRREVIRTAAPTREPPPPQERR
jgi:alpha-1,2-mannosyltransferase